MFPEQGGRLKTWLEIEENRPAPRWMVKRPGGADFSDKAKRCDSHRCTDAAGQTTPRRIDQQRYTACEAAVGEEDALERN